MICVSLMIIIYGCYSLILSYYSCSGTNTVSDSATADDEAELDITVISPVSVDIYNSDSSANVGDELTFSCVAIGGSRPHFVQLRFEGEVIR